MALSASNAKTTIDYISTIDFINERIIDPTFHEKYPGQGFMKIMDMLGKWKPVANPVYEWAEEDWIHQAITTTGTVTDPTAGVAATVTLSAADHTNSGTQSYPRLEQIVQLPNKVFAQITAKSTAVASAHTITLTPLRATDNIGAIAAGTKIIFITNAYGAGTDQGSGLTPTMLKYENNLMIIKEDYEFDSTQGMTKAYLNVTGKDGKVKPYWTYKGEKDTFVRFQTAVGLALLTMEKADADYTRSGKIVRTTEGLMPFIRGGGNTFAATGFVSATFDDVIKKTNKQKGAKSNSIYLGIDLATTIDNFLTAAMKNDQINYSALGGKEKAVSLGFKSFNKSGFDFHFNTLNDFSEPNLLGAEGFGYENTGIIVPNDQRKIQEGGKSVTADSLSLTYLAGDGHSRKYEHFETGGGTHVANKTNGMDETKLSYRCEVGFKGIAANRFSIIED